MTRHVAQVGIENGRQHYGRVICTFLKYRSYLYNVKNCCCLIGVGVCPLVSLSEVLRTIFHCMYIVNQSYVGFLRKKVKKAQKKVFLSTPRGVARSALCK